MNFVSCAGHGGKDPGACANGLREKDLTLVADFYYSQRLGQYQNANVKRVRTNDKYIGLSERAAIANRFNSSFSTFHHYNAGGGDRGEVIHAINGGVGKVVAQKISSNMKAVGQSAVKIYSKKSDKNGLDFYAVIRGTNHPAVIVEYGFIDNKQDIRDFDEDHEIKKIAYAVADAVAIHFGLKLKSGADKPAESKPEPSKPNTGTPTPSYASVAEGKKFVGNKCKELQTKLIRCGFDVGKSGADGIYGKATHDAVIAFQKKYCKLVDGLAGGQTFDKLDALIIANKPSTDTINIDVWVKDLQRCLNENFNKGLVVDGVAGPATLDACPLLKSGKHGWIVKLLQTRLVSKGYSFGTYGCDGKFGPTTVKVVKEYQASCKLTADGMVGQNSWKKLLGL